MEDMLIEVSTLNGAYHFHLSADKGFLPRFRPVTKLPPAFADLEMAALELPERLNSQQGARSWIDDLFQTLDGDLSKETEQLSYAASQTLMLILSLFGHAYRWDKVPPGSGEYKREMLILPGQLDQLWSQVAAQIGQLRVAAFWNTNLCNWQLEDPGSKDGYTLDELRADNIKLIYNWLPQPYDGDAEIFMRTFILVEAQGTHLLNEIMRCLNELAHENSRCAAQALHNCCEHFQALYRIYAREIRVSRVRPEIWPTHIQPFFGWNVKTEQGVLGGPSGMNLGCFQVLNTFLGLKHETLLGQETLDYRRYMPPHHRAFLYELDQITPLARKKIADSADRSLSGAFNDLIALVSAWRRDHAERGAVYVQGKRAQGAHLPQTSTGRTLGPSTDRAANYRRQMYERIQETAAAEIGSHLNSVRGKRFGQTRKTMTNPFSDTAQRKDLLHSVNDIRDTLAAATEVSEEQATLAASAVQALRDSGIMRMRLPKELGGFEADLITQEAVIEELAYIDPASAWCAMVGSASVAALGAFLPDAGIEEVFGDRIVPLVACSFYPAGTAEPVNGGYCVNGHWRFASGSRHADWVWAGVTVANNGDDPDLKSRDVIYVVLPAQDIQIHDNWQVVGLRGTGSCDFTIDNQFVPRELTMNWQPDKPIPLRGGPLFRLPSLAFVSHEHVAFAAGLARRALDELLQMATIHRGRFRPSPLTERHQFQRLVGESDLKLRSARALALDLYQDTWQKICRNEPISPARQAELRGVATYITDIALEIVTTAFRYGGSGALFQPNIFERLLRDMNAAAQHIMTSDAAYENHGKFLLQLPDADPMG